MSLKNSRSGREGGLKFVLRLINKNELVITVSFLQAFGGPDGYIGMRRRT